jgi:hypothetical protein
LLVGESALCAVRVIAETIVSIVVFLDYLSFGLYAVQYLFWRWCVREVFRVECA